MDTQSVQPQSPCMSMQLSLPVAAVIRDRVSGTCDVPRVVRMSRARGSGSFGIRVVRKWRLVDKFQSQGTSTRHRRGKPTNGLE